MRTPTRYDPEPVARAVLDMVVKRHPAVTVAEIIEAVAVDPNDPREIDVIRRAIVYLHAFGLVSHDGEDGQPVEPTRAMLRAFALRIIYER